MRISDWSSDVCSSDLWQLCGRHRPRHRRRERRHYDPVDDESSRRSDQQGQSHKAADVRTRKLPTSATASFIGRLTIDEDNKALIEHPAPKLRKTPRSSRNSLSRERLELGKHLLNWVEVGAVGRE